MSPESAHPQVSHKAIAAAARPLGRAANWTVGIAAAALVLISVGGYFYHRDRLAALVAEHLRLIVTGPSSLQAGAAAEYTVHTSTIGGRPLPAQVEVSLSAPDGKRLKTSKETTDDRGRLQIVIPAELKLPPLVKLRVVAWRHETHEEAEITLPVEPPHYAAQLALDKPRYRPGETIYCRSLCLSRFGWTASQPMPLRFEVLDPGGSVVPKSGWEVVADRGVGGGALVIPATLAGGQYTLVVRSPTGVFPDARRSFVVGNGGDGPTQAKTTSTAPDRIDVAFYPEGGDLVAGLENRVYCTGKNSQGKPVRLSGVVVVEGEGGREETVAAVETTHAGMGVFSFTPQAGEAYRLKILSPEGVKDSPKLPDVSADRDIVLNAGPGVFAPGAPLEFSIRAAKAGLPLVVAAYCRGVQVGQQPLVTKANGVRLNRGVIALDDAVGGVIRLTVYDYSVSPPRPVAQRLVYRRPARQLTVRAMGLKERYAPGEKVEMSLLVTNERGEPVPAVLGVAVVDAARPGMADNLAPALPTQFLLTGELQNPSDVEEADFYLSDAAKDKDNVPAAIALDLLLGVQSLSKLAALDGAGRPPVMFDNVHQILADCEKSLAGYQADRTQALNTLTTASFFGGLGLVLLVAMLGLMRIVAGMHLWIPAIGATTCCLIIGAILMDPGRRTSEQGTATAFLPYQAPTPKPADQNLGVTPPAQAAPLPIRQYVYRRVAGQPGAPRDFTGTLFWHPLLIANADGKVSISFDLPDAAATFLATIDAHGEGRIGAGRAEITCDEAGLSPPSPSKPDKRTSERPAE